jgi:hypothetical protein
MHLRTGKSSPGAQGRHSQHADLQKACSSCTCVHKKLIIVIPSTRNKHNVPALVFCQICVSPVGHDAHQHIILLSSELHCRLGSTAALTLALLVAKATQVNDGCHLFIIELSLEAAPACSKAYSKLAVVWQP